MARTAKHGWSAAVLAAYAASIGKNVRTAQRHANDNHPDFVRFAQLQAGENIAARTTLLTVPAPHAPGSDHTSALPAGIATAISPPAAPPEALQDDDQLSETGRMLKAAWAMWTQHYHQWTACCGGYKNALGQIVAPDHPMMIMHAKIIMDLRKSYNDALAKHQQWQIDNRRLIPAGEFHAFRSAFLIPLRNMLKNMPAEAAPLVNPKDQQQAIRGGTQFLHDRLNPQIERALDALDQLVPSLLAA